MPKWVRAIGPEARKRILEELAAEMSYRELASLLGITPAAVYKYLSGKAVPRDEVVLRAIEYAAEAGIRSVIDIVTGEIAASLEGFLEWVLDTGLASYAEINKLSEMLARAKLALVASLSPRIRSP